jgi:hypothetical protein
MKKLILILLLLPFVVGEDFTSTVPYDDYMGYDDFWNNPNKINSPEINSIPLEDLYNNFNQITDYGVIDNYKVIELVNEHPDILNKYPDFLKDVDTRLMVDKSFNKQEINNLITSFNNNNNVLNDWLNLYGLSAENNAKINTINPPSLETSGASKVTFNPEQIKEATIMNDGSLKFADNTEIKNAQLELKDEKYHIKQNGDSNIVVNINKDSKINFVLSNENIKYNNKGEIIFIDEDMYAEFYYNNKKYTIENPTNVDIDLMAMGGILSCDINSVDSDYQDKLGKFAKDNKKDYNFKLIAESGDTKEVYTRYRTKFHQSSGIYIYNDGEVSFNDKINYELYESGQIQYSFQNDYSLSFIRDVSSCSDYQDKNLCIDKGNNLFFKRFNSEFDKVKFIDQNNVIKSVDVEFEEFTDSILDANSITYFNSKKKAGLVFKNSNDKNNVVSGMGNLNSLNIEMTVNYQDSEKEEHQLKLFQGIIEDDGQKIGELNNYLGKTLDNINGKPKTCVDGFCLNHHYYIDGKGDNADKEIYFMNSFLKNVDYMREIGVEPEFILAKMLNEGAVELVRYDDSNAVYGSISGFTYLGMDKFGEEYDDVIKVTQRDDFVNDLNGDFVIQTSTNERGQEVKSAIFKDLDTAIKAFALYSKYYETKVEQEYKGEVSLPQGDWVKPNNNPPWEKLTNDQKKYLTLVRYNRNDPYRFINGNGVNYYKTADCSDRNTFGVTQCYAQSTINFKSSVKGSLDPNTNVAKLNKNTLIAQTNNNEPIEDDS